MRTFGSFFLSILEDKRMSMCYVISRWCLLHVFVVFLQDNKLHIYGLDSGQIASEKETLSHGGAVAALAYSSDGQYLVSGDAYRKVIVYSLPKYEVPKCVYAAGFF